MAVLSKERWQALSPHLERALEMADGEREAWLESLEAEDPLLAGDLLALLRQRSAADWEGFLEAAPPLSPPMSLSGQRIGAYTLISLIGQGGMGNVWLARRSDGRFEGRAAVKLLNASLLGRAGEERFRREGSILARLAHPHIARLIDAGVSSTGHPYLVLEHVEGEPIDRYCDARALGIEERLRLFLEVAAAVAHAHANLIVHRDLKPSNVLVDKDGQVKLLDFGIAKLIEAEAGAGEATDLTREGGRALTPEYAAPEQVTGGAITTATDVYALGTLLYELLVGAHPFDPRRLREAGWVEMERIIREEEPVRPSIRISSLGAGATTVADRRKTDPATLRRRLEGDLDWITLKALEKDRSRRYATASELAADVERHLNHEPVAASPPDPVYRLRKLVRRHRVVFAATAAVFLALAAGLAATVWQAREAARQRDFALTQLLRARGVNEFTSFLLGQAMPGGKAVTMRELLGRAEQLIDKRFANDRDLGVDLLVAIGDIYNMLEETDNARRTTKRAYETSLTLADPEVRANAACAWARTVALSGKFAEARRLIDAALAQTSEEARFDDIAAACLVDRGYIASTEGDPDATVAAARRALERLRAVPGSFPAIRANALHLLALGYDMRGETGNADRAFAQAMEQLERIGREETNDAATLLNNWALTRAATDTLGALALQGQAIAALEAGESAEAVPAVFRANYGRLLNRLARYGEARQVYERARDDARRHENARTVGTTSLGLARACRSLGDLDCARGALQDADGPLRASFPAGHFFLADLSHERGMLAATAGDSQTARRLLAEALVIHEKASQKHVSHVETLLELAKLELAMDRPAEAETHARRALELAEGFRGGVPRSAWVGLSQTALGEIELTQGNASEARRLFREAVAHMESTLGGSHPALQEARNRVSKDGPPPASGSVRSHS